MEEGNDEEGESVQVSRTCVPCRLTTSEGGREMAF